MVPLICSFLFYEQLSAEHRALEKDYVSCLSITKRHTALFEKQRSRVSQADRFACAFEQLCLWIRLVIVSAANCVALIIISTAQGRRSNRTGKGKTVSAQRKWSKACSQSLIGRGLSGCRGSGYSYTDARWALISRSSATEPTLLRQRQMANATNKRSRTTKIATYVSPPMPKP